VVVSSIGRALPGLPPVHEIAANTAGKRAVDLIARTTILEASIDVLAQPIVASTDLNQQPASPPAKRPQPDHQSVPKPRAKKLTYQANHAEPQLSNHFDDRAFPLLHRR